jgi:hypothetical protein
VPRRFHALAVPAFAAWTLLAQQPVAAPPGTTPPPAPKVDLALNGAQCRDSNKQPKNTCELGDTIAVGFTNLREWMADDSKNRTRDLVLVLDGRVMKGLPSRGPYTTYKELEFDLKILDASQTDSAGNRSAWSALLSRSKGNRYIDVGLALGGNPPYIGPATVKFQVFPTNSWLVIVFLLVLLAVFLLLAHNSDILRDAPSPPGGAKVSFSLARCQMAFWFFIILAGYNYIWMVTGNWDSLTPGALTLMGISAATGMGSVLVDSSKRGQRKSLQDEQAALSARLAALPAAIAAVPAPPDLADLQAEQQQKQARLAQVGTALAALPSPIGPSDGFLLDILRDETGVSFHRFQMAAWTIVIGFVFVVAVYRSLEMPDFSATLLGLMGISSGTYVGFKIPDPPK